MFTGKRKAGGLKKTGQREKCRSGHRLVTNRLIKHFNRRHRFPLRGWKCVEKNFDKLPG